MRLIAILTLFAASAQLVQVGSSYELRAAPQPVSDGCVDIPRRLPCASGLP